MIIIPIGREGHLNRTPFVTIGLALVLALVHGYTASQFSEGVEQYERAKSEYRTLVVKLHAELNARKGDGAELGVPNTGLIYLEALKALGGQAEAAELEVEEAMESGELYRTGTRQHDEWLEARRQVEEAEEFALFDRVGFVPAEPSVAAMFTSMFFHADLFHLIFNLVFLWAAGCLMESSWGHITFGLSYLACGFAAAIAHWVMVSGSEIPCVGASGAIAGMMGACLVVHARERIDFFWLYFFGFLLRCGRATAPAWLLLVLWFVGQIGSALLFLGMEDSAGVAFWAHIGGFGFGTVLAIGICVSGFGAYLDGTASLARRRRDAESRLPGTYDASGEDRPVRPTPEVQPITAQPTAAPAGVAQPIIAHQNAPPAEAPSEADTTAPAEVGARKSTARVLHAQRAFRRGDREAARWELNDVLRDDANCPAAHLLLAQILAEEWEFEAARVHGNRAVAGYCSEGLPNRALSAHKEL